MQRAVRIAATLMLVVLVWSGPAGAGLLLDNSYLQSRVGTTKTYVIADDFGTGAGPFVSHMDASTARRMQWGVTASALVYNPGSTYGEQGLLTYDDQDGAYGYWENKGEDGGGTELQITVPAGELITSIEVTAGIYYVKIWGAIYGGYKLQVGKDPMPTECSFADAGANEWVAWDNVANHPDAYDPIYDTVVDDFTGEPGGGVSDAYVGLFIRWSIYNWVADVSIGHGGSNDYTPGWQHVGWDDIAITVTSEGGAPGCGEPGTVYYDGDLNQDCYVNLLDFGVMAGEWMHCSDPCEVGCDVYWR